MCTLSKSMIRAALVSLCMVVALNCWAEQTVDRLVVLKQKRSLQVLSGEKLLKTFSVHLGWEPEGHKQSENDGRTPEGVYTLDWRKADEDYYRVIHISYPNENDKAQAALKKLNTGTAISLQGTPSWVPDWFLATYLGINPDFTDGSIGLRNEDIDYLWTNAKNGTTIEIRP